MKTMVFRQSFIATILAFLISQGILAQQFTLLPGAIKGVRNSSVDFGDYDNDGDLDVLLTGYATTGHISKLYYNTGAGYYLEQTNITLPGVWYCSAAWGDYNNDGHLDFILTGATASVHISKIYKNNGDTTFTEQTGISITPAGSSSVDWGDYDNDGFLDLLVTGDASPGGIRTSKVYRNNRNGNFVEQTGINLTGVYRGSSAWGDYDNDGFLDILMTGQATTDSVSKIYKNDGNGGFSEQTSIALTGVGNSSVDWGDYDNDGDLDILLTGEITLGRVSKVYRNDSAVTFTEVTSIALTPANWSSAAWGDYDNDGYLDILLTGNTPVPITKVYHNNGNDTFPEITGSFIGVGFSSVCWGDVDNDGDLDFFQTGLSASFPVSMVYGNNNSTANTAPTAPSNLMVMPEGQKVTFKWDKATDNETGQNGLSYNLYLYKQGDTTFIKAPQCDTSNGHRQVAARGHIQWDADGYTIDSLEIGATYKWSVQAIDGGLKGGSFASEQTLIPCIPPVMDLGNDTIICDNASVTLDAGSGFDSYLWSNGDTTQTLLVDFTTFGIGVHTITATIKKQSCTVVDTIVVSIVVCTGIEDSDNTSNFSFYPNPANGTLYLKKVKHSEIKSISVYNAYGQLIEHIAIEPDTYGDMIEINLSDHNYGIYFIRIEGNAGAYTKKVIMK